MDKILEYETKAFSVSYSYNTRDDHNPKSVIHLFIGQYRLILQIEKFMEIVSHLKNISCDDNHNKKVYIYYGINFGRCVISYVRLETLLN